MDRPTDRHTATYIELTHLYLEPPYGVTPLEFRRDFLAYKNYESLGYRMTLFA